MRRLGWYTMTFALLTTAVGARAQATSPAAADDLLTRLRSNEVTERRAAVMSAAEAPVISAELLLELATMSQRDPDGPIQNMTLDAREKLRSRLDSEFSPAQREAVAAQLVSEAVSGPTDRRFMAITLLPDFAPDRAAKTLEKLAAAPAEDPTVLARVFRTRLGLLPPEQRRPYIVDGLKSPHAAVVDAAAAQLGPVKDQQFIPMLRDLESVPSAGIWASLVLARWGEPVDRPVSVLAPLLESDRPWVRAGAARALTRSGDAELKFAIDSLDHAKRGARVELAEALRARFDALTEGASRGGFALEQELYKSKDRAAFVRQLKKYGLKAAAVYPQLLDMLASDRSNQVNKPLADAAVVALQDLYRLAAETEAKASSPPKQ